MITQTKTDRLYDLALQQGEIIKALIDTFLDYKDQIEKIKEDIYKESE